MKLPLILTLCAASPLFGGNGRVGAMVFGGVGEERIVLNESSMWSGSPQNADREGAAAALPATKAAKPKSAPARAKPFH